MRATAVQYRPMRVYYNLPSKSEHGRRMTGFLTPYRHFMWKQNELWRNVHEAQFEHLRKVYKRQWLEAFRVNSDEYIYKYNITKAAQIAQWESDMHHQEAKRVENLQLAQGRQSLKKKHLDLLREFHERQFFYWYERASERLQYMDLIQYVPQERIQDHIEEELNKYVIGKKEAYRLNFAGQMPMLEDKEGNIAQVPENLMVNHTAEHPDASATEYTPPQGTEAAEHQLLQMLASAQEADLHVEGTSSSIVEDSEAFQQALSEVLQGEDAQEGEARVARSMEETEEDREISRRAYIDRGKTGSRAIFRPRGGVTAEGASPPPSSSLPPVKQRKKTDKAHLTQQKFDRMLNEMQQKLLHPAGEATSPNSLPQVGEIGTSAKRLRDQIVMPSLEHIKSQTSTEKVNMQSILDKKYQRGKFKNKPVPDGDDL